METKVHHFQHYNQMSKTCTLHCSCNNKITQHVDGFYCTMVDGDDDSDGHLWQLCNVDDWSRWNDDDDHDRGVQMCKNYVHVQRLRKIKCIFDNNVLCTKSYVVCTVTLFLCLLQPTIRWSQPHRKVSTSKKIFFCRFNRAMYNKILICFYHHRTTTGFG